MGKQARAQEERWRTWSEAAGSFKENLSSLTKCKMLFLLGFFLYFSCFPKKICIPFFCIFSQDSFICFIHSFGFLTCRFVSPDFCLDFTLHCSVLSFAGQLYMPVQRLADGCAADGGLCWRNAGVPFGDPRAFPQRR
ncbi:hypothetical protein [Roseibium suaedae]|uniref:hypothetical protein n=1 Tax=Roseibium suaedae TaxID=735517 RepID=UPI001114FB2A|nr:hypothetical protein [Roseibium suaedae]